MIVTDGMFHVQLEILLVSMLFMFCKTYLFQYAPQIRPFLSVATESFQNWEHIFDIFAGHNKIQTTARDRAFGLI
jgi:hypothetical protein